MSGNINEIPEFLKNNPEALRELYGDDAGAAMGIAAAALEEAETQQEKLPTPITDDELWDWVKHYLNIEIPRYSCGNPDHTPPFKAFAEAFFARHPRTVWIGSRGFSGKSATLSALSLTEAMSLGASVNLLGGSGEQSQRVLQYIKGIDTNLPDSYLSAPDAPRWLIRGDPTKRKTIFKNGGVLDALMASQASVRGPHPNRLRGDEVDNMTIDIWDAAQGQPMESKGVREQVVGSSTWQNPAGTMTRELQMAKEHGWPVRRWCVPPGTSVTLADCSVKNIEDIEVGDVVLTGQGRGKPVSKIWKRDVAQDIIMITVMGTSDPIFITPEHEVPTNRGWIPAGELREKDIVFDVKITFEEEGNEYDFLDGWVLGCFLAEGSWPYKENWSTMCFGCHEKEVSYIKQQLYLWIDGKRHYGGRSIPGRSDDGNIYSSSQDLSKGCCVFARHSELRDFLQEYVSYGSTSLTKKLNKLPTNKEFTEGILEGWLFGDGCGGHPDLGDRIGYTVSKELAYQMFKLATSLGWAASINHYPNRKTTKELWRVGCNYYEPPVRNKYKTAYREIKYLQKREGTREEMFDVLIKHNCVKLQKGVEYPRYDFLSKWLTSPDNATSWTQATPNIHPPTRVSDNNVGRRVTKVEQVPYTGEVYDLTVDDDHTFHANGIVVSNCYACVLDSNGGWLSEAAVERKREAIPSYMWEVEYELAEPTAEGQAFDHDAIRVMFDSSLGKYEGRLNDKRIIEGPESGATYSTGADWAKSRDKTWIVTLRTDVVPHRVVAYAHLGRIPFPDMVAEFNKIVTMYDSYACHDAGGIGAVIQDYLEVYSEPVHLIGKKRNRIFSDYIAGVERGEVISPEVETMYNDHRWCTVDDLYSPSGHPPDSVIAMALAFEASASYDLLI